MKSDLTTIKVDNFTNNKNIYYKLKSYEMAQNTMNVGYWDFDYINNTIYWTPELLKLYGVQNNYQIREINEFVHPDEKSYLEKYRQKCIESKQDYEFEYRIKRFDGQVRFVREKGSFILDDEENIIRVIGFIQDITHNKSMEKKYRELNQYNLTLFKQSPNMIAQFDLNGNIVECNESLEETIGYTKDELVGSNFIYLTRPEDVDLIFERFESVKKGTKEEFEMILVHKQGEHIYVDLTLIPIFMDGFIVGLFSIIRNITENVINLEKLQESELKYRSIVETSNLGVFIAADNHFTFTNTQLNNMMGYDSLTDLSVWDIIHPEDREWVSGVITSLEINQSKRNVFCRALKKDGTVLNIEILLSKINLLQRLVIHGTILDISEQAKLLKENEYLAYHDHLTKLPNRRLFEKELHKQLDVSLKNEIKFTLIALDLDRFKYINDSLGHNAGDELLKLVARRINICLPTGAVLARMGGDEFSIILPSIRSEQNAVTLAKMILSQLHRPFIYNGTEINITMSIGIALFPNHGEDISNLTQNTDIALTHAKKNGKNSYYIFTSNLNYETVNTFTIENELRRAIRNKEFEVYFQPRVTCDGEIKSAEALIRWNHPEKGIIDPSEFLPIAEEAGLTTNIGKMVKKSVIKLIGRLKQQGIDFVPISINLSSNRLIQTDLVQNVKNLLQEWNVSSNYIEFEITEESLIQNEVKVQKVLEELNELGIRIALDDFGTGYSSLSYLTKYKHLLSTIKIDKSFFSSFYKEDRDIVSMIIQLVHLLKLNVVAEGIEKQEQLLFLKQEQCDEVQGYLFSKPVPLREFIELLKIGKLAIESD
jgi:diguanylate cyclase (GGDEF)-like protein/PAS domain S-box-containing protein